MKTLVKKRKKKEEKRRGERRKEEKKRKEKRREGKGREEGHYTPITRALKRVRERTGCLFERMGKCVYDFGI